MILQDFAQHLTQDLKVILAKILETSCQGLSKNLARSKILLYMYPRSWQDLTKIL